MNKQLNLKFESLCMKELTEIKNMGCRILILNSRFNDDAGNLIIEGTDGKAICMSKEQVLEALMQKGSRLNVDIVFLIIEGSEELAKVFIELGVHHVFCF